MRKHLIIVFSILICFQANLAAQTQTAQQDTLRELMRRIDILTEEIEKSKLGEVAERKYESRYGMGPAASQVYQLKKAGVSLAGYGEVVYQNFAKENDQNQPAAAKDQIDYLRNVVYVGFKFNDRILFNSEIEVEHGSTGKQGEVSMEFGYVEARLTSALAVRAGMVLVPVGIVNEFHEPPTFYGSLRPETESAVIPTTWRTNGFGLAGSMSSGIGYRVYLIEGLDGSKFSASGIRSGRQSGARSLAEDLAITGRVEYAGLAGVNLGASFYSGNSGQGLKDAAGNEIGGRVTILAAHGIFARHGLELRGLFAQSTIGEVEKLNAALSLSGAGSIGEKQNGFYLAAAYDVLPLFIKGTQSALLPFVQYEKLNTQLEVPSGFAANPATERTNLSYGIGFKPHPNVAFKLDYLNRRNEAKTAVDQFNVAVNYLF
ncbi:hypothetical protein L0337_13150 [candidate division KSB1 bacterium]|nr:hypothetical protein [candidate division KSB1 bacterium]